MQTSVFELRGAEFLDEALLEPLEANKILMKPFDKMRVLKCTKRAA